MEINQVSVMMNIWDLPGNLKNENIAPLYYNDANAIVLVYDISNEKSLDICKQWHTHLLEKGNSDLIFMLLGTKEDYTVDFTPEIKDKFVTENRTIHISERITSKSGNSVNLVFEKLAKLFIQKNQD